MISEIVIREFDSDDEAHIYFAEYTPPAIYGGGRVVEANLQYVCAGSEFEKNRLVLKIVKDDNTDFFSERHITFLEG